MNEQLSLHRRSIRLADYDYSAEGGYFITSVTKDRECLFGEVANGEVRLNEFGKIVYEEWFRTAQLRPNVELLEDEFVVMPNHIHGIIWLTIFRVGVRCNEPLRLNDFKNRYRIQFQLLFDCLNQPLPNTLIFFVKRPINPSGNATTTNI